MVAAHPAFAQKKAAPATPATSTAPRILSLELIANAPLDKMKAFYGGLLGLRVLDEKPDRVTIAGGATPLTFVQGGTEDDRPFYHFAFNIPENKVLSAWKWQKERTPLIPIPAHLWDPTFPNEVVDYRHWNAHSVFFLDPAGNVVEYIGRHDLRNAAPGEFTSVDILYASEIGIIVDDVLATAAKLRGIVGVESYRGESEAFTALGDEYGLLLVMKRGRILNFNPSSHEKAARVYRTKAQVRGVRKAEYLFPDFPY
ncbi:MAG: VOC family protein, partial [Bryobacteraceae bacterium]